MIAGSGAAVAELPAIPEYPGADVIDCGIDKGDIASVCRWPAKCKRISIALDVQRGLMP
jgi:hypothetical protein